MGLRIPTDRITPPQRPGIEPEPPRDPLFSKPIDQMSNEELVSEILLIASEEAKEAATGFAVGAAEGATLGFAGELTGGALTAADVATGEIPLEKAPERFREETERAERFIKEEQERSPIASALGTGVGMIGTAGATGLARGATAMRTVGKSALAGGITGAGFSEARIEEDPKQLMNDIVTGAVVNLATDLGGAIVLGAINKFPGAVKEQAVNSAIKASSGQNLKQLRRLDRSGQWEKVGRGLLEADEAGPPIVRFGSTKDSIAERAAAKREYFGTQIGTAIDIFDQAIPTGVSSEKIAARIIEYVDDIPITGKDAARIKALKKEAEIFRRKGDLTMGEAHKLKKSFKFDPKPGETPSELRANDLTKVNRIINDAMEEAMTEVSPEFFKQYKKAKEGYTIAAFADDAAGDRLLKDLNNRWLSPTDYFASGSAGIAAGGGLAGIAAGAAAGGINKLARDRGRSGVARVAKSIVSVMERSPATIQKWLPVLSKGAQKGGAGLIATHQFLINTEPDYASQFEEPSGITPPQRIGR